ncbi:MAG: protein kinase [Myxococcales bacterium]|nr:protein kinase [Myxococcales bacterium]
MEDLGPRLPYRVVRVLGEGSHGVVLEVEHKRLGKPFVVKLIQQRFSENRDVVQRFIAEAQRVARLDHEAFVPIVDLGETDDGRAYFVMEYVAGATLQQALRDRGQFPLVEGVTLATELLEGLAVAHQAQIVHRDIKPANLFVTARGRLKILDFGISKSMIDSGTGVQTAHGVAIGTPRYMSPEQAYGQQVSPATDLYAAALVLFEMLTGVPVFDGSDSKGILYAQIHTPAPSMRERTGRWFPEPIEAVIARALRKDPRERWQSAHEMATALRAALDQARAEAPPGSLDLTADERLRPTVRTSDRPPEGTTRPIAAEALVVGAASTSQAIVVSYPAPSAMQVDATARTEALEVISPSVRPPSTPPLASSPYASAPVASSPYAGAPLASSPASTPPPPYLASQPPAAPAYVPVDTPWVPAPAAAETTAPGPVSSGRTRSPIFLVAVFVGALGLALAAILGIVWVVRGGRDGERSTAASTLTPPSATSVVAPATEIPSAPPPAVPPSSSLSVKAAPLVVAKPVVSASASASASVSASVSASASASAPKVPSHYNAALEAMNAGDLEFADSEARLAVAQGGGVPAQLLLAQILERRGKKAAAREVYSKILETNPDMAAAVAGLKRCGG